MSEMPRYELARAGKAIRRLLKNPDELPQVFEVIEALQGPALQRMYDRLKETEDGRRLLEEEPDIVPLLSDREALRRLPAGSLGRAYLDFVEREGISAEGIIDASVEGRSVHDDHLNWVRNRLRDTHDLWHAATGYHGDVLGEVSLLAMILAQNFQPGVLAMIVAATAKGLVKSDHWLIVDGYVRGRRSAWLPGVRWEALLDQPLEDVRALLNVGEPRQYAPVRTDALRAQGVLPAAA